MRFNKQKVLSGVLATGLALSCMVGPAFAAGNDPQVSPAQVVAVKQETLTFSDVRINDWYYTYVMACAQHGAISGTTSPVNGVGTFNPNGKVNLGQFLAVLTRLIAADKIDTSLSGHWAMPNYSAAIDIGLIYAYEYSSSKADLGNH